MALTPAQIAALQQDIVWLVSETVDSAAGPQTVWVPKVYLANTTVRLSGDGALIAGGNLQLSANSLSNAGNLVADQALKMDADQFLHQGGDIRADSINVQATHLTLSTNLQDALRQASMSASDISLSGSDVKLLGAKLDATQNLSLNAQNSLEIGAARSSHTASLEVISGAMGNRTSAGLEEAGSRKAQVSGEWQQALGSSLNAGGNLSLNAGQDIILQGSQAKAGGTTQLHAGGNGGAGSAACASARLEVIAAKGEYETGQYNNKVSDMYSDAYGQIVNLLSITSVDAQNQQQVKDAMVNYAMVQLGVDKATAEQYVSTYDGMKVVAASMAPVIGSAAASKIEALAGKQRLSNSFEVSSLPDANGKNHITAVKGDAKIPVDKIELYLRGKASGDLEALKKEYNLLKDLQVSNQREFAKTPGAREKLNKLNDQIYNVERSREMAQNLNNAGVTDSAKNNAMIMEKLLNTVGGVTSSNRETSIVVSGSGGNVRIYATWKILPDGSKRLATVKTGAF